MILVLSRQRLEANEHHNVRTVAGGIGLRRSNPHLLQQKFFAEAQKLGKEILKQLAG